MSIRGVYRNGRVELNQPADWPEGMPVDVVPFVHNENHDIIGMTEEEQGADAVSIARWVQEFQAVPQLKWSEKELCRLEEWQARMKAHNLEAVRQQFEKGIR